MCLPQIAADGTKESIKFLASLVRDANRLKLSFPEATYLFSLHRDTESWVDRANIAIRSRICMSEIRSLIHRATEMPVDLSEYTDKLISRVRIADDWLEQFKRVVLSDLPSDEENMLLWMRCMREAINDGKQAVLHEMASEGSRIPVDIDCVKMLQVELDAKNWSLKAKKWIPDGSSSECNTHKRGRLEDIRDHVEKAEALREKLIISDDQKKKWSLDGEAELKVIVTAADAWFEKVRSNFSKSWTDFSSVVLRIRLCCSINRLLKEITAKATEDLASRLQVFVKSLKRETLFSLTLEVHREKWQRFCHRQKAGMRNIRHFLIAAHNEELVLPFRSSRLPSRMPRPKLRLI